MSRTLVLSMKRPHEQFGLPMSFGRRLGASGQMAWVVALFVATVLCVSVYIYQVNAAASNGFAVRTLEKRLALVQEDVAVLEDRAAELQAMGAMQTQIAQLGYVPADQLEFVDVAHLSYAFVK